MLFRKSTCRVVLTCSLQINPLTPLLLIKKENERTCLAAEGGTLVSRPARRQQMSIVSVYGDAQSLTAVGSRRTLHQHIVTLCYGDMVP